MDLNLQNRDWEKFQIDDVFQIVKVYGNPIEKYKKGKIPYISTSKFNNGFINFVKEIEGDMSKKNTISIDPISGKAFYHEYNFIGRGYSGASINLLYNNKMNRNETKSG